MWFKFCNDVLPCQQHFSHLDCLHVFHHCTPTDSCYAARTSELRLWPKRQFTGDLSFSEGPNEKMQSKRFAVRVSKSVNTKVLFKDFEVQTVKRVFPSGMVMYR